MRERARFSSGILPVSDVFGLAYVQRPTAIHQCFDHVVIVSRQDKLLVQGRRRGFYASYETSTNPHPRGAVGQGRGEAPSVSNATRCDNDDGLSRQRTFRVFTEVDDGWNQDRKWCVTGMSTTFSALSTYDINTYKVSPFDNIERMTSTFGKT